MNFDEFCSNKQFDDVDNESRWTKNYKNQSKNNKNSEKTGSNNANSANNIDFNNQSIDEEFVKNHIEKYKNMSTDELMKELFSESAKQKKAGKLDEKKLLEIEKSLMPLLDEDQKNRLKQLVDMLR